MTNPFEGGPTTEEKFMFGTLSLRANKVNLVAGASYTMPDLKYADGNIYPFKGKMLDPNGYATHAIIVLKCRRKDGGEYLAFRDFMYRESEKAQQIAGPALREHFGQNLEKIWGSEAEAKVEDVTFDDRGYSKRTFKVIEVYPDRATRENAEQAHFAQFSAPQPSGAEIADDIPGFEDEPMPWEEPAQPEPVGMPRDQAVNLLQPLWLSSGQDPDKFYEMLAGMPVLTPHFGTTPGEFINQPEIAALVGAQALQSEEGV